MLASFKLKLAHRLPACREVVYKMPYPEEFPVSGWKKMQYKLHLWVCAYCRRFIDQWETMHVHLTAEPPESLTEKEKTALKKNLAKKPRKK